LANLIFHLRLFRHDVFLLSSLILKKLEEEKMFGYFIDTTG
jgi:hypothetical protein